MIKFILSNLLILSSFVLLFLFSPLPALAANLPNIQVTHVRGHVVGPDGKPLGLARITATCDGKTGRGITNLSGNYIVNFIGNNVCGAGSTVDLFVEKNGLSRHGTGQVVTTSDGRFVDINMTFLDINFSVPEYNPILFVLAAIFSTVLYVIIRKKRFNYNYSSDRR